MPFKPALPSQNSHLTRTKKHQILPGFLSLFPPDSSAFTRRAYSVAPNCASGSTDSGPLFLTVATISITNNFISDIDNNNDTIMHLVSRAFWSLVGSLACLGSVVNAAGLLEIDMVFPRSNETYAPTDKFPVVFALKNAELAKHLDPYIHYFIRNGSNSQSTFGHGIYDLTYANYSTEPYFLYNSRTIDTEGPYELFAGVYWNSCDESGDQVGTLVNSTKFSIHFNIKNGGQQADLVAATANGKTCSAKNRVAINVTDQTREVPASWNKPGGTCAVLASASPTPTPNSCGIKIDTAVAASMSAALHALSCRGLKPPADCPEENGVQQLAVAGVASFAAVFGAIGFLLA